MANAIFLACASATGSAVAASSLFTAAAGTITVDTSVKRLAGHYGSWKLDTSSPAVTASLRVSGVLSDAGRRVSVWFYFPSVAPSVGINIIQTATTVPANVFSVALNTTPRLVLQAAGVASVIGTTPIQPATQYRVSLCYTITNATTFEARMYLNGVLEASMSNTGTLTNTGTDRLLLQSGSVAGVNFLVYADELYVDDGTDLADPGAIGVTAKQAAAGWINQFDTAVGSVTNRWDAVNERPVSTTLGWSQASTAQVEESYGLQSPSQGDVDLTDATIVSRSAWVYAKGTAGGTGTPAIIDDGTATVVTLTGTAAIYTKLTDNAAYSSSVGLRSTGVADDTFLYDCGVMFAYIAGGTPQARAPLRLLV